MHKHHDYEFWYTTEDDGVHLLCKTCKHDAANLGFGAGISDAIDAARDHEHKMLERRVDPLAEAMYKDNPTHHPDTMIDSARAYFAKLITEAETKFREGIQSPDTYYNGMMDVIEYLRDAIFGPDEALETPHWPLLGDGPREKVFRIDHPPIPMKAGDNYTIEATFRIADDG